MPVIREELFRLNTAEKDDYWFFERDDVTGDQWVMHEWSYNPPFGGIAGPGVRRARYSVDVFLKIGHIMPRKSLKVRLDSLK